MINNDMLEGKQGFATLEDVDQGTMTRFIEWLYRGYYHAAAPKPVPKPEQPKEDPDGQKAEEGSGTSSLFNFGNPKPTFSGVDATEALRGAFSAPSTSETPRAIFGEITPAATTAPGPRPGAWSLFGSAGSTQVLQSSINANTPATNERSERDALRAEVAARRAIDNSVPQWQGPNPFGTPGEGTNNLGASTTSERNSSPSGVTEDRSQHAKERFIRRKYNVRQTVKSLPLPRQQNALQTTHEEDFSEVFLCHAYLHVFADKYDIQTLKVLALEELHATLAVFTLHQERTGDILNLLRYVYKEAPEQANEMEDLRTLMTQYVESEFVTLVKDETLGTYLSEDNGEFLEDFLKILRRRLA